MQVKNEPSNDPSTSQSHPNEAVLPDDSVQVVPVKRELVDPDLPTQNDINLSLTLMMLYVLGRNVGK